jgi:hypothetical protein
MSIATNRSAAAVSTNHSSITPSNIETSLALRRAVAANDDEPLPYPPFVTRR